MTKGKILFLRNRPDVFNLGDYLCTPAHYFDFDCKAYQSALFLKGEKYKVILGGGAFNDLGVGQDVQYDKTVAWGVGSSIHGWDSLPTRADDLPYIAYGVRDPDAVSDPSKVLPCVTCLHPLLQLPIGDETNIFLNFNDLITDRSLVKDKNLIPGGKCDVYTNYLSELGFMKAFSKSRRIITNSYHVTYWSLLSGREVAIIGYSSKFRSLMKLVGLNPDSLIYYKAANQDDLRNCFPEIIKNDQFHRLNNSDEIKSSFIETNLKFADKLKEIGFVRDYRLRRSSNFERALNGMKYSAYEAVVSRLRRTTP